MAEMHVLRSQKDSADAEIIGVLEGVLTEAKAGKVSALVVGYMLATGPASEDITVDGAGPVASRIALAAMTLRNETDPD